MHDGKVFVLEGDPNIGSHKSKRPEYFWLCHTCAAKMTLRLGEDHKVTAVLLPDIVQGKPDGVVLYSQDRKGGLILRSLSFPEHHKHRTRRLRTRRSAA